MAGEFLKEQCLFSKAESKDTRYFIPATFFLKVSC
jgi:hypothetical protein